MHQYMAEVAKKRQEMTMRSLSYHFPAKKTRCLGKQVLLEIEINKKIVRKCRKQTLYSHKNTFRSELPEDHEGSEWYM